MKKRILIKGRYIIPNKDGIITGGFGRALHDLLKAITLIDDSDLEFEIYYFTWRCLFNSTDLVIKHYSCPIPNLIQKIIGKKVEAFYRRKLIGYDLLHIPVNYDYVRNDERFVMTIHDMIEYKTIANTRKYFEKCSKLVSRVITCSEYSKNDIIRYLHLPSDIIDVVPWGINHELFHLYDKKEINETLQKYKILTPYFFSCSCKDKRKNCDITLEAFKKISEECEHITLVLAWNGFPITLREKYQNLINNKRILILGTLSDIELAHLYCGASATYFISSYEGFGFPILESFACGTPCVTCKNTSLSEIGSDKAIYVKERDVNDTYNSMKLILYNDDDKSQILIEHAKKYTWEITAKGYLTSYKKALGII